MDDFSEPKRTSLLEYHTCEDPYLRADRVMHSHKCTQAQGALDSLPYLPSSPPSPGRAGNPASGYKHQGWRLMCRPVGSDGGLFPTGLADDYFPISSALSSLGRNTGNQPAENVRTPCHPSCLFGACNAVCPPGVTVEVYQLEVGGAEVSPKIWETGREISLRVG